MLEHELSDGILTLRLAHGKASALDLELCLALRTALEEAVQPEAARSIVLTGTGSIFSAGVDLPRLIDAGGDYVPRFIEELDAVLRALFLSPLPVVAAVNGHAIAGGAILALACDYRLMSGGKLGVPELLVGVPFPPLALEIVRFGVPAPHLQSLIFLGRTLAAEAALAAGVIDEIAPQPELLSRAQEVAGQLGSISGEVFALTKRQIREPFLRQAARSAQESAQTIDALWAAPASHDRIRRYIARTFARRD